MSIIINNFIGYFIFLTIGLEKVFIRAFPYWTGVLKYFD